MPCSELCLTCDDIWRKRCLTCQPNSSLTAGSGSACSCDPNYYAAPNGYTIKQCLNCHSPLCKTCSSGDSDGCLTCLWIADFVSLGVCRSCDINDSPECPPEIKVTVLGGSEELARNFTLKFTPPLNTSLPADFQLSAELLTTKHFTFEFKRKEEDYAPLTITNQTLIHQNDSSLLHIGFLEKMRVEDTEHINIAVKDSWVYRTRPEEATQKVVYFKKRNDLLNTKKKPESSLDKGLDQAAEAARRARVVVVAVTSSSAFSTTLSGTWSSLIHVLKFFNVLELISNLSKLNIELGHRILVVIEFINNLNIPEIGFLARLSPIKDSDYKAPDASAYLTKPRGTRGKITESNSEIFIASGQNFFVSLSTIVLLVLVISFGRCLRKDSRFLGFLTFLYQILFGLAFFDFQLISVNEISMFDYSTLRKATPKFNLSLLLSMTILIMIVSEFYQAFQLIRLKAPLIDKEGDPKMKKIDISPNQRFILEKYTGDLELSPEGRGQNFFILIENLRFFVIQLVIGPLQLLNRAQAFLALIVNLCYFIYFFRLVGRVRVFESKFLLFMYTVQECCYMVFIATITLFSFTENSGFSSSSLFEVIETFTIVGIIGTTGTEFVVMVISIYLGIRESCSKKKKKSSKKNAVSKVEKAKVSSEKKDAAKGQGSDAEEEEKEAKEGGGGSVKDSKTKIKSRNQAPKEAKIKKVVDPAKEGKSQQFGKFVRGEAGPFGEEPDREPLKEDKLKRPRINKGARRMRKVGIPVKRKVKKPSGVQITEKKFEKKTDAELFGQSKKV